MASRGFDPGPLNFRKGFFPLNYRRTHDARRAHRQVDAEGIVQEKQLYVDSNAAGRYFTSGETRQTKPAPWSARQRPTHFVSIKLPQKSTLFSSIQALHNDVKESFTMSQWMNAFIPLSRLHLTLSVLTIQNQEQQQQQLEAAQQICNKHFSRWLNLTKGRGFALRSNCLGFFDGGRVAFARLTTDYDYQLLAECVKNLRTDFHESGIDIKGNPHDEFIPHLTIAKVTPKVMRERNLTKHNNKLPRSLFTHVQWDDFGLAHFGDVGLCSMKKSSVGKVGKIGKEVEQREQEEGEGEGGEGEEGKNNNEKTTETYWDELVSSSLFRKQK